jgi:hypothetical protein
MTPDFASLDDALDSLRRPGDVEARLAALRAIVEHWHGPIAPEDGFSDADLAGFTLPMPLARWYRWAGRRRSIMSGQNFLFEPDETRYDAHKLKVRDGKLAFHMENQGCFFWSTLSTGDDPPVFGRESESEPWRQEVPTLSEHLILTAILEAVICHAPYRACSMALSEDKLDVIAAHAPALAIGPWLWCETHFFAGSGVFMTASPVGEETGRRYFSVWLGARHEGELDYIRPLVGDEWEMAGF